MRMKLKYLFTHTGVIDTPSVLSAAEKSGPILI